MSIKWIVTILLAIAVGVLGVASLSGDGFLGFTSKAKAEQALDEARNVETAMDTYAITYGEGKVDFGDTTQGEDLLKYLKHYKLVQEKVGTENNRSGVDRWVYDQANNQVLGVVQSGDTCRYMNSIRSSSPLQDAVPECGSVEAESAFCCQDSTGQYGNLINP